MPPVLSSWAAVFAAQELMYRCEQHLSGSGFLVLIFFDGASTQRQIRIFQVSAFTIFGYSIKWDAFTNIVSPSFT